MFMKELILRRMVAQSLSNMLELVRYQKQELPMAAGVEEVIYSAGEMILMENRNKQKLGNMADILVYSIPYPQIKKIAALKIISGVCKNR